MTMQTASRTAIEQAVRMARAYAAEQMPWFSPALFAARLVFTDRCPSLAGIDSNMRVYFHPGLVGLLLDPQEPKRSLSELAWVWVHEISHALRDHADRARVRKANSVRWNVAADLEINDAEWAGLTPPTQFGPLLPSCIPLPSGQLAEYYYQHIPDSLFDAQRAVGGGWFDEGSGVHGEPQPWEIDAASAEAPAISALERKAVQMQVAASLHAHGRGDTPGQWLRWAERLLKPRINWREKLRRRVRGAMVVGAGARLDYTFRGSNRREAVFKPLIRPCLSGDYLPRIACVVDTSGSISGQELRQSMSEVRGVLASMRTPITVIPCDAVAYEPACVLTDSDFLQLRMQGGGGTNMIAGIEAALRLRPPPDVVLVLTDGYTAYPQRPYRTPVLFGILNLQNEEHVPKPPIPPWRSADVIVIDTT